MKKFNVSYTKARRSLLKHINGNNLVVLDVGCATGENGKYLLENKIAKCMYGFELNEEMAEQIDQLDFEPWLTSLRPVFQEARETAASVGIDLDSFVTHTCSPRISRAKLEARAMTSGSRPVVSPLSRRKTSTAPVATLPAAPGA